MASPHKPVAASRVPTWAIATVAVLCLVLAASSWSSEGSSGKSIQLSGMPWSPVSQASGVAFCTRAEAAAQAAKFKAALAKEGLYSACPAHKWLSMLPNVLEPGQDFVMFDIGCNKGYESATMFSIMDPDTGISSEKVYETLESVKDKLKLGPTQGQCNDHKGTAAASAAKLPANHGAVTVHCFEPSGSNYRGLKTLQDKFFATNPQSRSSWHLYNMAVTNFTGSVDFPSECNTELCSLGGDAGDPTQKGAWTKIKATTVDDFAATKGLLPPPGRRPAFFLKIDTEGFDPTVLTGARRLLAAQVPSVVLFEYHNKQAWAATSLRDVALDLASSGYVCYFDGAPTLTRITGCWDDSLEIKNWSNVVCAVVGTKYHSLLQSLSWAGKGAGH